MRHFINRRDPPEAFCVCGHSYDDHAPDDTCLVCDCQQFEEYTEQDEAQEGGDIECDERREGVYD